MLAHILLSAVMAVDAARQATAHGVVSNVLPKARISLPATAQYAGEDHFLLYGIADCHIYAFVDADPRKRVERLYWVQFEGYVPSMRKLHHRYTSKRHASLGGMDFYVDTWTEKAAEAARTPDLTALKAFIRSRGYALPGNMASGSDEQHVLALLRRRGYAMPADTNSVRLVHLMDSARKELMIIYSEAASSSRELNAAERKQLIRRALSRIQIF